MKKQMTKEQRQKEKVRRQQLFKIFDWGLGVPLSIFLVLWLVGGSILTLAAVFAGSALTLGLLGWPVAILGFGITFGVAWVIFKVFTETGGSLQKWAADAERDPEEEARRAAERAVYRKLLFTKSEQEKQKEEAHRKERFEFEVSQSNYEAEKKRDIERERRRLAAL